MGHGIENRLVHDAPLQVEPCRRQTKSVLHGAMKAAFEPLVDGMIRLPLLQHLLFEPFLQLPFR